MGRRSGRRPGDSGTRDAIRAAAGRQFAEHGYDRTSIRAVAREAGVDPALVSHYFGSKPALFAAVVRLPFDPAQVIPAVAGGDPARIGERLARFVVGVLEDPHARRPLVGLVRAAASEPAAARMVRGLVSREIIARIVAELDVEHAQLRANLVASQLVGLVLARHVVMLEPLASASPDTVVAAIAPTLQRYLGDPL